MNLRIHRLAVAEIDDEVDYYEARQVGLGAELEGEIDTVLTLILRFPEVAPRWKDRANGTWPCSIGSRSPSRTRSWPTIL
jgi:hypothetical protein